MAIGGFRPDIEGLRAVAVILVVLDHLSLWPHGGFIGVDVFFVISGFLITGLLLNEATRAGRISFIDFYKRRARRILPASLVVLASSWVAAGLVFRGPRVSETHDDVLWSLGFSANIHFAHIGTDYFQANRPPSLVQHYWSLAVEEQFYLVWPLVMLVMLGLVARYVKAKTARTVLLAVVVAAILASFAWALHESSVAPTAAYFSTFVRAWELGLGASIAVAAATFPGIPRRLGRARGPLVLLGLIGIVLSGIVVRSSPGFPAPMAAAPVLAAGLVVFAGLGGSTGRWALPLTNPVSGYIGRVSYSLYLWHWPTIIVAGALLPTTAHVYYPTVILAMAGLTILSYHFIETPFRTPINARADGGSRLRFRLYDPYSASRAGDIAIVAASLMIAAGVLFAVRPVPPPPAFVNVGAPAVSVTPIKADPNVAQPPAALTAAINVALGSTSFPKLKPSLGKLGLQAAQASWTGCRGEQHVSTCTFPSANATASPTKVAVVLGDSISLAWLPAIRAALEPRGWKIYGLAKELCPAADVSTDGTTNAPATAKSCDRWHAHTITEVNKLKPSLVIMSSATNTLGRLRSGSSGSVADSQYEAGMVKTERLVAARGRRVVTLAPPPVARSLPTCYTAVASPSDCVAKMADSWYAQSTADAAAAKQTGTTYVDTHLWFCSNDACPAFIGVTPVFYDGVHLTKAYATSLGSELATSLGASPKS